MICSVGHTFFLRIVSMQGMPQFYHGRGQNGHGHDQGNNNTNAFMEERGHTEQSNQPLCTIRVKKNINYGSKKPKPIRLSIFFSNSQKNRNCPKSQPTMTKIIL